MSESGKQFNENLRYDGLGHTVDGLPETSFTISHNINSLHLYSVMQQKAFNPMEDFKIAHNKSQLSSQHRHMFFSSLSQSRVIPALASN
jgi:hypothetical protein